MFLVYTKSNLPWSRPPEEEVNNTYMYAVGERGEGGGGRGEGGGGGGRGI